MAKNPKNYQRTTPEEEALMDEHHRALQERIAYHEAKAREEEERQAQGRSGA